MLTRSEIEEKIWDIFDNMGLIERKDGEILIQNEEIDSIQLVSIIVEIEERFGLELPDEYMNYEFLLSFNHMVEVVEELLNNSNSSIKNDSIHQNLEI